MAVSTILLYPEDTLAISAHEGHNIQLFFVSLHEKSGNENVSIFKNGKEICTFNANDKYCDVENCIIDQNGSEFTAKAKKSLIRLFIRHEDLYEPIIERKSPLPTFPMDLDVVAHGIQIQETAFTSNINSAVDLSVFLNKYINRDFFNYMYYYIPNSLGSCIENIAKTVDLNQQLKNYAIVLDLQQKRHTLNIAYASVFISIVNTHFEEAENILLEILGNENNFDLCAIFTLTRASSIVSDYVDRIHIPSNPHPVAVELYINYMAHNYVDDENFIFEIQSHLKRMEKIALFDNGNFEQARENEKNGIFFEEEEEEEEEEIEKNEEHKVEEPVQVSVSPVNKVEEHNAVNKVEEPVQVSTSLEEFPRLEGSTFVLGRQTNKNAWNFDLKPTGEVIARKKVRGSKNKQTNYVEDSELHDLYQLRKLASIEEQIQKKKDEKENEKPKVCLICSPDIVVEPEAVKPIKIVSNKFNGLLDKEETEEEAKRKAEEEEIRKAKEAAEKRAKETAERKEREAAAIKKAKAEAIKKAKAEAQRKAKEEAERKAREEAEKKAKLEAEKKAKEEKHRKAKEEADRKAEQAAEAERQAKEAAEAERKAKEEEEERKTKLAAERKAKQEAEEKAKLEAEKKEKEEAEKQAKLEAEKKAKEEEERKAKEEEEKKAKLEAEKKAKEEEKARIEAEKKAEEEEEIEQENNERYNTFVSVLDNLILLLMSVLIIIAGIAFRDDIRHIVFAFIDFVNRFYQKQITNLEIYFEKLK